MTVPAGTTNKIAYTGTTATSCPVPFVFYETSDLKVYKTNLAGADTLLTITTNYTVTGGDGATGTVTLLVAPLTTDTITIVRELPLEQDLDLENNDPFDADLLERALDQMVYKLQQIKEQVDRALVYSVTTPDEDIQSATELLADIAESVDDAAASAAAAAASEAIVTAAVSGLSGASYEVAAVGSQTAYDMPVGFPALDTTYKNVSVYADGVKQAKSSYTVTDANTVTFGEAFDAGTALEFVAIDLDPALGDFVTACQAAQSAAEAAAASVITVDETHTWTEGQNVTTTALSSSSGAVALDLNAGPVFTLTMTENTTISAPTNKPSSGQRRVFWIEVTQHASSAKTLAWNSVFKFPGGSAPTLSTGASALDVFTIISTDGNLLVVPAQDFK